MAKVTVFHRLYNNVTDRQAKKKDAPEFHSEIIKHNIYVCPVFSLLNVLEARVL